MADHGHKIVPPKYYLWNFVALAILMTATIVAAQFSLSSNPNGINLAIALFIAGLKATCIVSIFMGVAFSSRLVKVFALAGFSWLIVLFLFTLTDYVNPMEEWGTPYSDMANPGAAPLPGGSGFQLTGSEVDFVKSGQEYVPPGGHGLTHEVEEGANHAGDEAAHGEPSEASSSEPH